jgi:hypothetical protein
MTIDVISVPDCPNHSSTVARIKAVLARAGVPADVREILVTTEVEARACRFMGSPTVLVNGKDLEGLEKTDIGLSCRVYGNGSGVPPDELIRIAIDTAGHGNPCPYVSLRKQRRSQR